MTIDIAGTTAEVLFTSMSIGIADSGGFARVGGSISVIETGTGVGLKEIGFQVVNFQTSARPGSSRRQFLGFRRMSLICATDLAHPVDSGP